MSDESPRQRLARLRAECRTAERERNCVGMVLAELTEFREAVSRGDPVQPPASLSAALDRFGPDGESDRPEALSYLTVPLAGPDDDEELTAFARLRSVALVVEVAGFVDALEAYVARDDDWTAVAAAFDSVLDELRGASRTEALQAVDDLVTVFEVATGAALAYREDCVARLNEDAKAEYLAGRDDPLSDLEGQPVALLPVRLETRFVGPDDDSDAETDELRIRVFPDQVHVDSHEPELTDDEVHWGRTFWTRTWLACHKQVERWDAPDLEDGAEWIPPDPGALPEEYRGLVADFDPAAFATGEDGYREIKTGAWRRLAERFGRERASWVVRATAPETLADELLGAPLAEPGSRGLPDLSFPAVERRPSSWTSQPRARLLPDRWVASLHWEDADGGEHRTTVTGAPVREPLPVGPSPEAVSTWRRDRGATDASGADGDAPPGLEWMVDFAEARASGMALTVDLSELSGFDADRGFTRVVVLGARGSMEADASTGRLADLFDAHHYTDGLSVLAQSTPTNVFDDDPGYSSAADAEESVDVEVGPPLVAEMDGTDGDLLARAFGFAADENEQHVFAHVENADGTEQLDARHMNAALWPATVGYFLRHMLVSNDWVLGESLWENGGDTLSASERRAALDALLPWVDAYRDHFVDYVRARGPLPAIRVGKQPYGVLPAGALAPDADREPTAGRQRREAPNGSDPGAATGTPAASVDGRLPADLAGWLQRFGSTWSEAVDGLPWTSGSIDDETLVEVLQREAVSSDVVKRQYRTGGSGARRRRQRARIRATLRAHDMTELDPRFANLVFRGTSPPGSERRTVAQEEPGDGGDGPPPASGELVAREDFVDEDAATTIGTLATEPPDVVRKMGVDLDPETLRAVLDAVSSGASETDDGDGGTEEASDRQDEATTTDPAVAREAPDDVADVVTRMLDESDLDSETTTQVEQLVEAVGADEVDSLVLTSLLELLLHYATMHAYLNGRVRLGTRFGDPGVLAPDPQYYLPGATVSLPGAEPYYAALEDPVPDDLTAHPVVEPGDSYADALFDAAVNATPPTSMEPRTSEFADSLSYLSTRDPADLATAMVESLDLSSHRLDAWWTSLSTRRLAEVRRHQRLWEPDGGTYEAWEPDDEPGASEDGSGGGADRSSESADHSGGSADQSGGSADHSVERRGGATGLDQTTPSSPGVHVGAYGFVEDLVADPPGTEGEYVHAPSLQHATTAALLRSGALAHEGDPMGQALSVDLSADRVREALGIVYGVRDGRSLGEVLGYRFERSLHENGLSEYVHDFRERAPAVEGGPERTSDAGAPGGDEAARGGVVDGYRLFRAWKGLAEPHLDVGEVVDDGDAGRIAALFEELEDAVDAVSDLLTAESVHQLGKGNFDRVAASVDALARGTAPPDPQVARTPRDEVGVTHRSAVLFGDPTAVAAPPEWLPTTQVPITSYPAVPARPDGEVDDGPGSARSETPAVDGEAATFQVRSDAEPALDAWVGELLPAPADVELLATYRWTARTPTATGDDDDAREREYAVERTVALDDLALSPLDVLALGEGAERPARSALEDRVAYHLLRDRPTHDPPIPATATVDLAFTETERERAVPVADLLEVVGSVRTLVLDGRAVDGTDLSHPAESPDAGYTRETVDVLRDRATAAETTLASVHAALRNRLAVLDPSGDEPTLLSQLDAVVEAAEAFAEGVPIDSLVGTPAAIDGDLDAELGGLLDRLPTATRSRASADERVFVRGEPGQAVAGRLRARESSPTAAGSGVDAPTDRRRRVAALAEAEGFEPLLAEPTPPGDGDPSGDAATDDAETATSTGAAEAERLETERMESRDPETTPESGDSPDGRPESEADPSEPGIGEAADAGSGESVPDRFRDVEVDVLVWSTAPTTWFERSATTTSDGRGAFSVPVDFSDVDPGTSFATVGVVDGEVAYAAHGRVVDEEVPGGRPDDAESTSEGLLPDSAAVVPRLLWLNRERRGLSVGGGAETPASELHAAIGAARWQSARRERELLDPSWSTLSEAELAAVDSLLALESVDPSVVDDAATAVLDDVRRMGVPTLLGVSGDPSSEPLRTGARRHAYDEAVRNRIRRYRENPVAFNREAADAVLGFAPRAALAIDETDDPTRLAGYLHVLLDQSGRLVRSLDGHADEPHRLLVALRKWLYHPDAADDRAADAEFADVIGELADAVEEVDWLEAAFEVFEPERATDGDEPDATPSYRASLVRLLGQLRDVLAGSPPGVPDPTGQREEAADAFSDAVADFRLALDEHVAPVRTVTADDGTTVDGATAFRHGVLETVRVPLVRASYFGVYGSTPRSADGGTAADEETLRSQARVVTDRVETRLEAAGEAVPAEGASLGRAVDAQQARLRAMFGDRFVVLPPFTPPNGDALARTFGNDALVDAGSPLAAETWLQRVAQVRDRPAALREALSYVEAVTGTLHRDLEVGQLPHRADDDWVGVDGVTPDPGQLSLVAQFGLGLRASDLAGPVCGVFVDEHVERVPADEETTGLAVNYDEPGNRAPQSILLAVPPEDGTWSMDALESAVRETMRLYKFRAVDLEDLPDFGHLLPMLSFAYNTASPPETPSIDFGALGRYDHVLSRAVASSYDVFAADDLPFDDEGGDRR